MFLRLFRGKTQRKNIDPDGKKFPMGESGINPYFRTNKLVIILTLFFSKKLQE